jgi:serine/threonine protein kinase/tetratricopeptide (TPR) repeat protein
VEGDRLERAETIFHAVVDLSAAEREARLEELCGDDSELRVFVERLLRHHETGGGGVLDRPPSVGDTETTEPAATPGQTLGPYVLRERIGSGGMGEVWRAEQTTPVRRTVALKLIKAGMDSRQVIARFEAERQALALMDHPAIAKVFDAGTTLQGRPYFAMEYVPGVPITEYCDARKLGTHERLELFQRVCEGVQHAHQKAVIHRDLKPSNILVSDVDGKPQPRIIDFGVAKATTQKLPEKTMYTAMGQLIGTPEYMSPEQADLTVEDVDTRTDVYSLGVILYELLAGALPFEAAELRKAGFEGILRLLREKDPPRPSTKVSSLGERMTEVAQNRRTEPRRLVGQLRGDLDWIVMRSLEKDRNRRYASPQELAQDLTRHLQHEPVLAGPPSPVYRTKKFVRRHRVPLAFVALVFLGITAGLVQSNRQRLKVEAALATAQEERARAVREAEKAEQVSQFVQRMLGSNDPFDENYSIQTPEEKEFARRLLNRAAVKVETELADQPEVLADIQEVLGVTYKSLGFLKMARPHLDESLALRRELFGNLHPDVATVLEHLGDLTAMTQNFEDSKSLLEESLEIRRTVLGEKHPDVATTLLRLGYVEMYLSPEYRKASSPGGSLARAERYARESLEIRREIGDVLYMGTSVCMRLLADIYRLRGDVESAVSLLRQGLAARVAIAGPEHYCVSWDLSDLGKNLMYGGDPAAAEPFLRRAHAIRMKVIDEHHHASMSCKKQLAECLQRQGKFSSADSFLVETLRLSRECYPTSGSAWRGAALRSLPVALAKNRRFQGDEVGAEAVIREALAWAREVHGDRSPEVASVLNYLAYNYYAVGSDEQVAAQREALSIHQHLHEGDHQAVVNAMIRLAHALRWRGDRERSDLDAAEAVLYDAQDMIRRLHGDVVPWDSQESINRASGLLLVAQGRPDEAESLLRKAVEIAHEHASPFSLRIPYAQSAYGACLTALGRYKEADSLLVANYEIFRRGDAQNPLQPSMGSRRTAARLIDLYRRLGDSERVRVFEEELSALEAPPKQASRILEHPESHGPHDPGNRDALRSDG